MNRPIHRIVALHEEPATALMLKRLLEPDGIFEVTGARTAVAALDRIREPGTPVSLVLVHWGLPSFGALHFMSQLHDAGLPTRPCIFGFSGHWTEDDLARCVQTGVNGLLNLPIQSDVLTNEFDAYMTCGEATSRTRLLKAAGRRLLHDNPALFSMIDDPAWRDRMQSLVQGQRGGRDTQLRALAETLLERLDQVHGQPIGPEVITALRAHEAEALGGSNHVASNGQHLAIFDALFASGHSRAPFRSDASAALTICAAIVGARPARDQATAPSRAARLQECALDTLTGAREDCVGPDAVDFVGELALALGLGADGDEILRGLGSRALEDLARCVLMAEGPVEAADQARLALLRAACAPGQPIDLRHLSALAASLGVGYAPDPGVAMRLIELMSGLSPGIGFQRVDADRLAELQRALAQVGGSTSVDVGALRERLGYLVRALEPGAEADLRTLSRLVDAWSRDQIERIGPPAVGAAIRVVTAGRSSAALTRFYTASEARSDVAHHRLLEGLRRLRDLKPAPALDTLQLRSYLQSVVAGPVGPDDADLRTLLAIIELEEKVRREALGQPGGPPPSSLGAARATARAGAIARVLGLDRCSVKLDDAQLRVLELPLTDGAADIQCGLPIGTVEDLRVLASLLLSAGDERGARIARYFEAIGADSRSFPVLLHALSQLGAKEPIEALRAFAGLETPRSTAQDVAAHLESGRMEAAVLGLTELPNADAHAFGLLNETALALRRLGRGDEGEPLFRRAERIAPDRLLLLFNFARERLESGDLDTSARLARRLVERSPDFRAGKTLLGEINNRRAGPLASESTQPTKDRPMVQSTSVGGAGR